MKGLYFTSSHEISSDTTSQVKLHFCWHKHFHLILLVVTKEIEHSIFASTQMFTFGIIKDLEINGYFSSGHSFQAIQKIVTFMYQFVSLKARCEKTKRFISVAAVFICVGCPWKCMRLHAVHVFHFHHLWIVRMLFV